MSTVLLGTLDLRYGVNTTRWVNDGQGSLSQPGSLSLLQDKNKLIALTSPKAYPGGFLGGKDRDDVTSMQSSIALFNYQEPAPAWEIYVDGRKVDALPFTCKQGQRITIKDGVSYLGIIPLPATDLGRDAEVTLEAGQPQFYDFYRTNIKAALVINSYNFKRAAPLAHTDLTTWNAAAHAYGGFIVELGDVDDYGDFTAFQQHLTAAKLDLAFDQPTDTVQVKYTSGPDTLEAASRVFIPAGNDATRKTGEANLTTSLVNGQSPYLPAGLERDTPYCQQGLGHVAKNGATLTADPDRRIFLLTEPKAGVYCGWNPLPDLTAYTLTVPGGLTVTADGKIGLTRVVVRPAVKAAAQQTRCTIEIDTAFKPGQQTTPGVATALLITGAQAPPTVTLNGAPVPHPVKRQVNGQTAYVIPLPPGK